MMEYGEFRGRLARNGNIIIEGKVKRHLRAVYDCSKKEVTFNNKVPSHVINYFKEHYK